MKLWAPPDSAFSLDSNWLLKTFKQGYRPQVMILKAENVLEPEIIRELNKINSKVVNTYGKEGEMWTDVCFK